MSKNRQYIKEREIVKRKRAAEVRTNKTLPDGSVMYSYPKGKKHRLYILVHGFKSTPETYLSYALVDNLESFSKPKKDTSVLALNLYEQSKPINFSVTMHYKTIIAAVEKYEQEYDEIILVASSASSLSALKVTNRSVKQIILVSPAFNLAPLWSNLKEGIDFLKVRDKEGNPYFIDFTGGLPVACCSNIIANARKVTLEYAQNIIYRSRRPVYVIRSKNDIHYKLDADLTFPSNFDLGGTYDNYGHKLTAPNWGKIVANEIILHSMIMT